MPRRCATRASGIRVAAATAMIEPVPPVEPPMSTPHRRNMLDEWVLTIVIVSIVLGALALFVVPRTCLGMY
jgi:hypothetical protein